MIKAFSQAADNNKQHIAEVLKLYITEHDNILEIGSGTGQHAAFFATYFPSVFWHTSDLQCNHASINEWLSGSQHENALRPIELDISIKSQWPTAHYDMVFSANTAHIMAWEHVRLMLEMAASVLPRQGWLILYGPFNVNNRFTSHSNAQFNHYLKSQNTQMGLRNIEAIEENALQHGLSLMRIHDMPAHNKILALQQISA